MERLVRSCYRQGGYVFAKKAGSSAHGAGDVRVARLASNENPEAPSPAAVAAAQAAVLAANRYPTSGWTCSLQPYGHITAIIPL